MNTNLFWILGILWNTFTGTSPIEYQQYHGTIGQATQKIYQITVDTTNPNIMLQNGYSYDTLFGFQETSKIAKRHEAIAAVNGAFFESFGQPMGLSIHSGNLQKLPLATTPVVMINQQGDPVITDFALKATVSIGEIDVFVDQMNDIPKKNQWTLYTPIYGSTTRVETASVNYIFDKNGFQKKRVTNQPVTIPPNGCVLTYTGDRSELEIPVGTTCGIRYESTPNTDGIVEGFQTGGWLIRNGQNVAKKWEAWMGLTTNLEPRTAVGKLEDGRLTFAVIDGRQPDISMGVAGYQLAAFMKKIGCRDAAYLDGGASSTMVLSGEVVNHPSNRGKERKVGHSIMVTKSPAYLETH